MTRLTDAKLARWEAKLEKLTRDLEALTGDVRSVHLNAKGGRYTATLDVLRVLKNMCQDSKLARSQVGTFRLVTAKSTARKVGSK